MTKFHLQQIALKLRKEEKSYSQIKKQLDVSKSTLSRWLSHMPLSREQIRILRDINEKRIERFRGTMLKKKNTRLGGLYKEVEKSILPLSTKELLLCGLFLYWGEGRKDYAGAVHLNNTDPGVVKFYLFWLLEILKIPKKSIKVYVHLYQDMNIEDALNYWGKVTNLPRNQFLKPYIKTTNRSDLTQKGFGHGTCGLITHNVRLKELILTQIKVISDYYGEKI